VILPREEYQDRIKKRLVDCPMLALLGPSQAGTTTMTRAFGKILATERQVQSSISESF
jgi:phosphoribulokinase